MTAVAWVYDEDDGLLSITPLEQGAADTVAQQLGRPSAKGLLWQWATNGYVVIVTDSRFDGRTWYPTPTRADIEKANIVAYS